MLLALAQWLQNDASFLRVFSYLTFRAVMATITALLIGLVCGPAVIRKLTAMKVGQAVRKDGPQTHLVKSGTPTMGGVLIVLSTAIPTLLWADLGVPFIWLTLFALLGFAAIGFVDDYAKVAKKQNLGLTARNKLLLQILVSLVVGVALLDLATHAEHSTQLVFPFFKRFQPDLVVHTFLNPGAFGGHLWPLAFVPFLVFIALVIVGSSNAVNLTDGLDGLAIGCTVIAAGALTVGCGSAGLAGAAEQSAPVRVTPWSSS